MTAVFGTACEYSGEEVGTVQLQGPDSPDGVSQLLLPERQTKIWKASDIHLTKELLYDRYTLKDEYPYKDTVRSFKWKAIKKCLAFIENMQQDTTLQWAVLSNYKNLNGEASLVRRYVRNEYKRVSDTLGSLDYVELSEDEALDLALSNNKGIVEIIMENEYEKSDYEETSHRMESSWISLGNLQGEEFVVDNDDEVAQVYVRIPETGGIVPIKELKGFRRVPLEPGESRAIDIELDKEQLRYWDTTKEQFILPAGTFDVMVGASSKDIRLQTIIKL